MNERSGLLFKALLTPTGCLAAAILANSRWGRLVLDFYAKRGVMETRILFVEDDADFREIFARLVQKALARRQLDVVFVGAGSVSEARSRLGEGGLDAALIDVALPDGNGLDPVREINDGGVGDHQPTLVLTANLGTFVAARAMEMGARGALSKVVSVPETTYAIKSLIDVGGG